MRGADPRLQRYAASTQRFLRLSVVLGAAQAALVLAQAFVLASVLVDVIEQDASLAGVRGRLAALVLIVGARGAVGWLTERAAHGAAADAKSDLRRAAFRRVGELGPYADTQLRSGELVTLATRGVDALDPYFARYLPQLSLAVLVPVATVLAMATQDLLAAVLVAVTVPLIPLFMAVIGVATARRVDRQWQVMGLLSGHFLDVVAGLPTLKAWGRERDQERAIAEVGEDYRTRTMGVLRVSFLSSFALELLSTLSVAIVAVAVGLRLVYGGLDLHAGLTVLLLAPEAYLPIRLLGQHHHAAAEGLGAARRLMDLLDMAPSAVGGASLALVGPLGLTVDRLEVRYPGRSGAAVSGLTFDAAPATLTALVGRTGCGKSSALAALAGVLVPTGGGIGLRDGSGVEQRLTELRRQDWESAVGLLPQDPYLIGRTVGDAVRLGRPEATDAEVVAALRAAGLDLAGDEGGRALPDGLSTPLAGDGADGAGLSAGQARRVALARLLIRQPRVVLLDEPTAALDPSSERAVLAALDRLRRDGRTVVVATHRPALAEAADLVVDVEERVTA